jgi:hypothetical protein
MRAGRLKPEEEEPLCGLGIGIDKFIRIRRLRNNS